MTGATVRSSGAAAWAALLPEGTARHFDARGSARSTAVPVPPWASRRAGGRLYVAVPSRSRPAVIARLDPGVLRYLADAVLSVPPGASGPVSVAVTVGRRLLRHAVVWRAAAVVRAGRLVLVIAR